jgi:hypothetical protein
MSPVFSDGPLTIYELKKPYRQAFHNFVTVNTTNPRLRELALIPSNSALISSVPQVGHEALFEVRSFSKWTLGNRSISTTVRFPRQMQVLVQTIDGSSDKGLSLVTSSDRGNSKFNVATLRESIGPNVLSDGNFSSGGWGSVGNCDDAVPVTKSDIFGAKVLSNGGPSKTSAIELTASIDSACVVRKLPWSGGPMLLHLLERSLKGSPARLCVFQQPSNNCAELTAQSTAHGWHQYSTVVYPVKGTKSLVLFLYADSPGSAGTSIERYTNITFRKFPDSSPIVLVGRSNAQPATKHLITLSTGYSTEWVGPQDSSHVIVDGLRNGWLVSSPVSQHFKVSDIAVDREPIEEAALVVAMAILATLLWWFFAGREKWAFRDDSEPSDLTPSEGDS